MVRRCRLASAYNAAHEGLAVHIGIWRTARGREIYSYGLLLQAKKIRLTFRNNLAQARAVGSLCRADVPYGAVRFRYGTGTVLHRTVRYLIFAFWYRTVRYRDVRYRYGTVPSRIIPYGTVRHHTDIRTYRTVPYRTVPYNTARQYGYRTVPYCTVPYRTVPVPTLR